MFTLIIDFDSTFVTVESLDEAAKLFLKEDKKTLQIKKITEQAMNGELDFTIALEKRLELLDLDQSRLTTLVDYLKTKISHSFLINKYFFQKNSDRIYVISGGFTDFIYPTIRDFGIKKEQVLANTFLYNKDGKVTGFDPLNCLSKSQGKVKQVEALNLKSPVYVIGDGYTDYEIREQGPADLFFAYTESVFREKVVSKADFEISNFDKMIDFLKRG
jgi:D-3-phosphoglycerate dehydrogenase / 2-oxoglutarate reductase